MSACSAPAARCGSSALRSVIRWGAFGTGIVYGRFRVGHFWNVKRDLMIQQREAFEAQTHELQNQVKDLETQVYRLNNPDWNKKSEEGEATEPEDPVGKFLFMIGYNVDMTPIAKTE